LKYSTTFAKILLVMFGRGISLSTHSYSIMWFMSTIRKPQLRRSRRLRHLNSWAWIFCWKYGDLILIWSLKLFFPFSICKNPNLCFIFWIEKKMQFNYNTSSSSKTLLLLWWWRTNF
jgi:hypothetical protein